MADYVSQYTGNEIDTAVGKTQNPDTTPTASSNALLTSGGAYNALQNLYVVAGRKSGTVAGNRSTAEGIDTTATGDYSHAENHEAVASGWGAHAEGDSTTASGAASHTEGANSIASGTISHAEGYEAVASGTAAHAEGNATTASGPHSHTEGEGTVANHRSQHVFGEYNEEDASTEPSTSRGNYVEIVGNGASVADKSNARTLDWDGNEVLAGKLTLGAAPENDMDAATKKFVLDAIAAALQSLNN